MKMHFYIVNSFIFLKRNLIDIKKEYLRPKGKLLSKQEIEIKNVIKKYVL